MIKNKITPLLNNRISTSIKLTAQTGKDRGFFICKNEHGVLFPGKTFYGETPKVKDIHNPCPTGGTIKGSFHTKTFIKELRDEIRKEFGYIPATGEKRLIAASIIERRHRIKGIKDINVPTYEQALYTIVAKCVGTGNDTICIGNDLNVDNIECWTVKENIKEKECKKAISMAKALDKSINIKENKKERKLEKWMISSFNREKVILK